MEDKGLLLYLLKGGEDSSSYVNSIRKDNPQWHVWERGLLDEEESNVEQE